MKRVSFLQHAREHHEGGLPKYVEQELRRYLKCGILAHGFLRAYCESCGRSVLVAFSCKRRGVCPSCNARRMSGTAAHLVDHVIPDVPLRQWVLSVPFELRLTLARHAHALTAVGRIFVEEVFRWQRERARELGTSEVRSGAVQFPQRFGGSLNLNVHYHVAIPDGVFTRTEPGGRADFVPLPRPTQSDLEDLALNVEIRVMRWLRRRRLVMDSDEVDYGNACPDRDALDACLEGSLGLGELTCLPDAHGSRSDDGVEAPTGSDRPTRRSARYRGFDVHAGVVTTATDREGKERLLRYCARPPLSLARLSVTAEGLVAYRLRKPWDSSRTHRMMSPLQFLARLAALVPPPRHPLIRFHGAFAPHSAWRSSVVPVPVQSRDAQADDTLAERSPNDERTGPDGEGQCSGSRGVASPSGDGSVVLQPVAAELSTTDSKSTGKKFHAAPRAITAGSGYIDWAELLKRVYDVDALACPCGGRLRFIALITDQETAQTILEAMALPAEPPPVARARSPDFVDEIPPDW